ncbi:hypothetical protein WR25_04901 [Diploscapter pachys]|uniref:BRO1 domain-containing protein n=1 Tax=Diploscapter pachys TaxID=2018661 RepID=A0A2A2JI86_9BILA|nr:hypothetical protein WR25_04901 [Diploscapter pachys]
MAHWFHRNPIKPTEFAKFELGGVLTTDKCSKICAELRMRRQRLLEFYTNAGNSLAEVDQAFVEYLRLFAGFLVEIEAGQIESAGGNKNSKLLPLMRFKWGHSMLSGTASELSDGWFEAYNQIYCMAIWLMKHAAWVAGKDEVFEREAKECLNCLKRAAGMFEYIKKESIRLSGATDIEGSDFDGKIIEAYMLQATAEAQEVIVGRAIEMKHDAALVSAIAANTAMVFMKADMLLSSFNEDIFSRWRRYLELKHHIYQAYAYCYLGESFLAQDKCGDAVRCCTEGVAEYKIACDFTTKYANASGPVVILKFVLFQRVPDECPKLDTETNYGLAKSDTFDWNPSVYAAFDLSKANMPDFSKMKQSKGKLDPVKEEKVYQSEKDPNNSSGCVIA